MNRFSRKIFEDYIVNPNLGTITPMYTSIDDAVELARGRQVGVMAYCTNFQGNGSTSLTVALEHCADGRYFTQKSVLINAPLAYPGGTPPVVTLYGGESRLDGNGNLRATPPPTLKHARLAISVSNPGVGGAGTVRVAITVTGRGSPEVMVETEAPPVAPPHAPPGSMARHDMMMNEIRALADAGRHLPPVERAAWLLQNVSPESRAHLQEFDRRYRAMSPETRRVLLHHTRDLVQHAVRLNQTERKHLPEPAHPGSCCEPGDLPASKTIGCGCDGASKG